MKKRKPKPDGGEIETLVIQWVNGRGEVVATTEFRLPAHKGKTS